MSSFTYGITMSYNPDWGKWEMYRELRSNAHDTGKFGFAVVQDGKLIIHDDGDGLAVKHLFLGEHHSAQGSIGQFGEGLKIAALISVRLGMVMTVQSGKRVYSFDKETVELTADDGSIDGVEMLRANIEDAPYHMGTTVTVEGWGDEDFDDRFISPGDWRILIENEYGKVLLGGVGLYVKGVFTCELPSLAFGYDSPTIKMNRDRASVSESETNSNIGNIWSRVTNPSAWRAFFLACKAGKGERLLSIYLGDECAESIRQGWIECHGDAVIGTDDDMTREATYRGAKVIDPKHFGSWVQSYVLRCVPSDKEYVVKSGGIRPKVVSGKHLSPEQKRVIKLLRAMGKKVYCGYAFEAAELGNPGECDMEQKVIRIDTRTLEDERKAKEVAIHELAHALYGSRDATHQHNISCCKVGVMLMG